MAQHLRITNLTPDGATRVRLLRRSAQLGRAPVVVTEEDIVLEGAEEIDITINEDKGEQVHLIVER